MGVDTVLEAFIKNAGNNPDKLCVIDKGKALNYSQLLVHVKKIAKYLQDRNVKYGDVVGIRATQSVEFVAAFLGAQYAGAVPCALEKSASAERTEKVLQSVSSDFMLESNRGQINEKGRLDLIEAFNYLYVAENIVKRDVSDDAEIIFTTGTTGESKGIRISYRAEVAIAENVIDSVSMSSDEVELITTPVSHSLAIRRFLTALYIGSTAIISENFLIYNNFWGLIEKYNVTAIVTVPSVIKLIIEAYGNKIAEYASQLKYIQLSSAPLHEELKSCLRDLLPGCRLYNIYGSTEAGCTAVLEFSKYSEGKGCIGRPTVNTKVLFVDENRNRVSGAEDESSACLLAFEGPMNMSGYINEPGLTQKVLDKGVVYTSDIGYVDSSGMIYLMGRVGEVINSGGLKINPNEIEEVVLTLADVTDCACIPVKDARRGEIPKLFVILKDDADTDVKEIKKYLREKLEDYKVPDEIELTDSIPRTFNGKIKRAELQKK